MVYQSVNPSPATTTRLLRSVLFFIGIVSATLPGSYPARANTMEAPDLTRAVQEATHVVAGRRIKEVQVPQRDGYVVYTAFHVTRALKGDISGTIYILSFGGVVERGAGHLKRGCEYLLLLHHQSGIYFETVRGPDGVYSLCR